MDDAELPISLISNWVYCPRRAWLEASGEQVESFQMEYGSARHARVDDRARSRANESTAVDLVAPVLGVTGRCDVLRRDDGTIRLIEHKSTPVRRTPTVTQAQRVQLVLQALALEEMGDQVASAEIYFTDHRVSIAVSLDDDGRAAALAAIDGTRRTLKSSHAPAPRLDADACRFCSHVSVCIPDAPAATRRVFASDPEGQILHLTTPGSRAQLRSGRLQVVKGEEELASLPLERVAGLVVHGNVDVASSVLRELLYRRRVVVWCSFRGAVVGWASSAASPNGSARIRQAALSQTGCLPIARAFIEAKIANQCVLLRRSSQAPEAASLRAHAKAARSASSLADLFGIEGQAAGLYFQAFPAMLKVQPFASMWVGRRGRGAGDPLNAALNFVYALLLADVVRAVVACGLDPHAGMLHSPGRNKPAFALDLMEEFRAPVGDSVVLRAINNGELKVPMFVTKLGAARLTDDGRKALVRAYEERVEQSVRHPVFGYAVTWRRAMEVQARMALAWFDGTRDDYRGIRIR